MRTTSRRRFYGFLGLLCAAVALSVAAPAAQATVGNTCKMSTLTTPKKVWVNWTLYAESTADMWCEVDAMVTGRSIELRTWEAVSRVPYGDLLARAGVHYTMRIRTSCTAGFSRRWDAYAQFVVNGTHWYNTSAPAWIAC